MRVHWLLSWVAGVSRVGGDAVDTGKEMQKMSLSREEVLKVATLARLRLTEDEVTVQMDHLNSLLGVFERAMSVGLEGVEPTTHPFAPAARLREDTVQMSLPVEAALANAPAPRRDCLSVPVILDE